MPPISRRHALAGAAMLALPAIHRARAEDAPIRIGVLTDMSSWGRDNGGPGGVYAATAAAAEVNSTLLGRKIEIVVGDHRMTPDIGVGIARRWLDQDGVLAICDLEHSGIALATMDLCKQKDRIALMSGPGSSDITNSHCNDRSAQFTYDTYALGKVMAQALLAQGGNKWFFISVDYAYGKTLQADATRFVLEGGGQVVGSVAHPAGISDFSSMLLQAQSSGANVIAFANTGTDCTNCLKQADEFGLAASDVKLAALSMFLTDVHSAGLKTTRKALMVTADYWDMNPDAAKWCQGYFKSVGLMPTMLQSGTYGAVRHYLKAVKAAGTTESGAVMEKMRELHVQDVFTKDAVLRRDGRVVRDMYLARVKTPEESKYPWDYLQILQTVKGDVAYRPLSESTCPLVKA